MRKALVFLCVFVMLALGGCATFQSTVGTAQQMVCNPTADQQAVATQVLNFLSSGTAIVAPISGIPITADAAMMVFISVEKGVCVGLTELQNALAWFQALTAGTKMVQKGMKAMVPVPDVTVLWALAAKGK